MTALFARMSLLRPFPCIGYRVIWWWKHNNYYRVLHVHYFVLIIISGRSIAFQNRKIKFYKKYNRTYLHVLVDIRLLFGTNFALNHVVNIIEGDYLFKNLGWHCLKFYFQGNFWIYVCAKLEIPRPLYISFLEIDNNNDDTYKSL